MAINLFGSYCIVVRRSARTVPWEERARAHLAEVNRRFMERNPHQAGMPPFEDKALFAFPAAQGPRDAESTARELVALGCAHMGDLVMAVGGEFKNLPLWLQLNLDGTVEHVVAAAAT